MLQLLDLFMLDKKQEGEREGGHGSSGAGGLSMSSVLASLPALWDSRQYEEEYDLSNFLQSLRRF